MATRLIDLTGQKFGRLTVLERAKENKNGNVQWKCICDCGTEVTVKGRNLKSGDTKSCGCFHKEKAREQLYKHGMGRTRPYDIWIQMRSRCSNPNDKDYHNYGARGIKACEEWMDSFENFWEDMGPTYQEGLTIERINNNGNYGKENCKWATKKEQANNKRDNVILEIKGEKHCAKEWSRIAGINYHTILRRARAGMTGEDLLKPPRW